MKSSDAASLETSALTPLLTGLEAGNYLGKSEAAMAQWRYLGTGPRYVRLGRSIRYLESELADFVSANAQDGGSRVA